MYTNLTWPIVDPIMEPVSYLVSPLEARPVGPYPGPFLKREPNIFLPF
jgi:hypothetical protein